MHDDPFFLPFTAVSPSNLPWGGFLNIISIDILTYAGMKTGF